MNWALMLIIINHYGRSLSILLQLVTCYDMFKTISNKMAQSYEIMQAFFVTIADELRIVISNHYGKECLTISL